MDWTVEDLPIYGIERNALLKALLLALAYLVCRLPLGFGWCNQDRIRVVDWTIRLEDVLWWMFPMVVIYMVVRVWVTSLDEVLLASYPHHDWNALSMCSSDPSSRRDRQHFMTEVYIISCRGLRWVWMLWLFLESIEEWWNDLQMNKSIYCQYSNL